MYVAATTTTMSDLPTRPYHTTQQRRPDRHQTTTTTMSDAANTTVPHNYDAQITANTTNHTTQRPSIGDCFCFLFLCFILLMSTFYSPLYIAMTMTTTSDPPTQPYHPTTISNNGHITMTTTTTTSDLPTQHKITTNKRRWPTQPL